ncbi:relaxase/mobilization nuclease domain-containing protein [Comamonas testosteroni]|uniref:relaxase/mobilization nuclease domain-containing protein n=1 Tax=Comamonas testosteroni TaxID=285 RepID=UPI00265DFDCD|nr:relaxase/mobilization nuclease domain-containing protein [Comamonas testosteroni]WKL16833.1 relaxase/mobilization nuclease domain-containing protein [Comamonas testosteroni]
MIIKIFKQVGKSSSRGPISYLLGKDADGKVRNPAPVLLNELTTSEGSKDAVAFLIDSNTRQNKYTSGVIAFRDDEKPTPKQIQEILKDFRKTFLPGLDENRAPVLWVMHRDKGNVELHFVVAKQDAKTQKALNIAPPGPASEKLFEDFQKLQNDKLGFKQVVPSLLKAQFLNFEKRTRKAKFSSYLVEKVKNNEIQNRSDLLRHLQHDLKWKVSRIGDDYISVIPTGKDKPIRLKGPAFTSKADYRELLKQSSNQPTKLNPDQLLKVQTSLSNGIKYRAEYNEKTFNKVPNFKNRSLNLKGSIKNKALVDVPKVAGQATAQSPQIVEQVPASKPSQTLTEKLQTFSATQATATQKKALTGSSGPSGGGSASSSGSGSLSAKMLSLAALMNAEKDPVRKYALLAQLIAVTAQRNLALSREKEAEKKRLSKIKIR